MRQFEIREVVSDALVVIVDAPDQSEANEHAMWWTREFGTVCYARELKSPTSQIHTGTWRESCASHGCGGCK